MKTPIKIILAFLVTFAIAFATTALFELNFVTKNPIRYALVCALVLIELLIGFFYIKDEAKNLKA